MPCFHMTPMVKNLPQLSNSTSLDCDIIGPELGISVTSKLDLMLNKSFTALLEGFIS